MLRCSILIMFLLLQVNLKAQEVKGKLVDQKNNPVEGVYIFNVNSGKHTHSNEVGLFKIEENSVNDTLKIGALGYEKLNIILKTDDFYKTNSYVLKEQSFQLEEVVIRPKINGLSVVSAIDLKTSPVKSSQELLQKVPGLLIGQHAGGGKAEQLFLRGFDIDHGTDITISVDGMPVNMVSHAHGQGYADLHFLIPETLETLDFGKGPYYANKGNFNTAAYVDFYTKESLDRSLLRYEIGDFGWNRALGMFNFINSDTEKAYVATEFTQFDGPFETPQNFSRVNLFGKYTTWLKDASKFSISASHFTSVWDASGQIPQRAVDNGSITRFGAIDATEGGQTSRTNINASALKIIDDNTFIKSNIFYSNYNFELFSNFTFFLEDPVNGDQIKQKEQRNIFGLNSEITKKFTFSSSEALLKSGVGIRADFVDDVELSHTLNRRTTLNTIQLGDVKESNSFAYASLDYTIGKWTIIPGVRVDHFKFIYVDKLQESYANKAETKTVVSPKLNFLYRQHEDLQFFLKSGMGFHSNDTRVVIQQSAQEILPAAYGVDLGTIWRPFSKLLLNATGWYLYLEQEFVYVGDAGIVEPSGETKRFGVDLGARWQINDWLFLNTDATITNARSIAETDGQDYIPLAPDFTLAGGISILNLGRFNGGFKYRYLDDRPANEDNSIVAKGYFVADLNANYQMSKALNLGLSVENLFNVEWNETQFATTSRLQSENASVEEIHFTPGTPFFIKGTITYTF
ncbi:TonB-dependent receptor [Cellulophaga tyrosinoxydans]|uniref:Outer membrane receptor proteins, mostly Fe transport n=1 Tax=Cellulophaga tyrosinoxydans TaxID=504486 RepID=A0A1W2CPQ3_9FLAO|nr:TonB-dependent receptor [Cellulophaga tyrosinoxydans]SMC87193.1 Outer membrane receptor proteins, mostly Fe transport [Cellulophaga tyrosinoxydans]